jgi:hypothetical protein
MTVAGGTGGGGFSGEAGGMTVAGATGGGGGTGGAGNGEGAIGPGYAAAP